MHASRQRSIYLNTIGGIEPFFWAFDVSGSTNQGTNSGATETIFVGLNPNGTEPIAIGGTKTTGNVLTVVVTDAGLTSGQESVAYTVQSADTLSTIATAIAAAINADTNLQAIGVTAAAVSTVVNVKSVSTNATTYSQLRSSGATENSGM